MVRRPVDKKWRISSPFGTRVDPKTKEPGKFHKGVDFACPVGSPCFASFGGVVEAVKKKDDGNDAGNRLWLYSTKFRAGYFHLDDDGFVAKQGQKVKKGELVAFSGETGRCTGPHLHFELQDLKSYTPIEPVFEDETHDTAVA